MIRFTLCASLLMLLSLPAHSDGMSAAEFDTYTKGKTLYFGRDGRAYGAEVYLPNRRVRWSFLDGVCQDGYWYEDAGEICFIYENQPDPQCWSFRVGSNGLIAQFESNPDAIDLYEAVDVDEEMICLGPEVGV